MNETLNNIQNLEIKDIYDELQKLDLEFDKQSEKLNSLLVSVSEKIKTLKENPDIYSKYSTIIRNLEYEIMSLKAKGEMIDNSYNYTASRNIDFINIPKGNIVLREGEFNGKKFILSRPENDGSYANFIFTIFEDGKQKNIEIKDIKSAKDGGSLYINTNIGNFYMPSSIIKPRDELSTFTDLEGNTINGITFPTKELKNNSILEQIKNISAKELFEERKDVYDALHKELNRQIVVVDDEILKDFHNKVKEYIESFGYKFTKYFDQEEYPGDNILTNEDGTFSIYSQYIESPSINRTLIFGFGK